ncbi:MAG: YceD family protein [Gammaproteobacteria bacterium]|nr:YceD family protein [Gammaproteobacteria bacterium]
MTESFANPLSGEFDPQVLAERNVPLVGELPTDSMHRLQAAAVSVTATVNINLKLTRAKDGSCRMDGTIVHTLGLCCVRCLDEVEIPLHATVKLALQCASEAFIEQPEGYDLYEYADNRLDLIRLVEDELLLALPLAPKHVDISLCNQGVIAWLVPDSTFEEHTQSPFAILKR